MDSKKLSRISYKIVKFPYDYMKEVIGGENEKA